MPAGSQARTAAPMCCKAVMSAIDGASRMSRRCSAEGEPEHGHGAAADCRRARPRLCGFALVVHCYDGFDHAQRRLVIVFGFD
jgi:hypothetical protein